MSEIKVNLRIVLPGRTLLSKEECLKTTQKTIECKTKKGKSYKKTISVQVEDWGKMHKHTMKVSEGKGHKPEDITFYTRKSKPALQVLNISKEAYVYMIGNECPYWIKPKKWETMNRKEKLESHLQRIVEHLGGTSFTYQVLED